MDTKSLARSKRAHSQHLNKKHNPNPKSKQPQTTTNHSNANKPPKKQPPSLPTNWGRYQDGDDDDDDQFDSNVKAKGKDKDVVLPKSKGADFSYLLSEAQSQLDSNTIITMFPSFDFDQGISSMLSVRGNGLLSWIGNDNFVVDDSTAISTEASFLSLDLHALASKLEKIDVSRRLFIEADLLPSQQDDEASKETSKLESEQRDNRGSGITEQWLNDVSSLGLSDEKRSDQGSTNVLPSTVTKSYSSSQVPFQGAVIADQPRETTTSTTSTSSSAVRSFSIERTSLVNQMKDDSIQIERNVKVVNSIAQLNSSDVVKSIERKPSAFAALEAEAELDMLLSSFGETGFPKTAGVSNKPVYDVPISHWGDSTTTLSKENTGDQLSGKESSSSTSRFMNVDIDDTVDDLLRDTSITRKNNSAFPKQESIVAPLVPASSLKPSAVLDDFDSWLDTI